MTFRIGRRAQALRDEIVKVARWGVANNAQIHYGEVRPIPVHVKPFTLPITTDCSGWFTLCYCWAGARDPNGRGYDGQGFTGTLLTHGRRIRWRPLRRSLPGDAIIYGPAPGHHVVLVVEPGDDPLVCSNGDEAGPEMLRHSQVVVGQPAGFEVRRYRLV